MTLKSERAIKSDIDPSIIANLVLDHIEHVLPAIIQNLSIPKPMPKETRILLEAGITGRLGFRHFQGERRARALETIKTENFRRQLRLAIYGVSLGDVSGRNMISSLGMMNGTLPDIMAAHAVSAEETTVVRLPKVLEGEESEVRFDSSGDSDRSSLDYQGCESPRSAELERKAVSDLGVDAETLKGEVQTLVGQDVRGKKAVLKYGKLIGLLWDLPEELVPKGVEVIKIPGTQYYQSLSQASLLNRYQSIAADLSVNDPVPFKLAKELRLLEYLMEALEVEERWAQINNRRFFLITKKHMSRLSGDEMTELDELQDLAWRRSETLAPLPFVELARIEDYIKKASLRK